MSDLLIKGMEMPPTGVYIASVDNTKEDKPILILYLPQKAEGVATNTVITSGEMISVPPHGRLIDEGVLNGELWKIKRNCRLMDVSGLCLAEQAIKKTPTVIPEFK